MLIIILIIAGQFLLLGYLVRYRLPLIIAANKRKNDTDPEEANSEHDSFELPARIGNYLFLGGLLALPFAVLMWVWPHWGYYFFFIYLLGVIPPLCVWIYRQFQ